MGIGIGKSQDVIRPTAKATVPSGIAFVIAMIVIAWAPAVLQAGPGCFPSGRILKSGTWPIQADGYHHVRLKVGNQTGFMWDAITAAIEAWNAKAPQTKIYFDTVDGTPMDGTQDLSFHHGDTTVTRYGQDDPCAFEAEDSSNPNAPAEIWFNDGSGGVTEAAEAWSGTSDFAKVIALVEHEMGHFLLMQNAAHQDSSTIMTTYDFSAGTNCADALTDAHYPADLNADASNVVNCTKNKTYELPGGDVGGGGGDKTDGQEESGGTCYLIWAIPRYVITSSSYQDGEGRFHLTVTYTLDHYDFYNMGEIDCGSGLPMLN
jgi:hypothetical protein